MFDQKKHRSAVFFFNTERYSVMMAALAMHVSVVDFFFGGVTHRNDFYRKKQYLSGQRMVAIHGNGGFIDGSYRDCHPALRRLGLKLHAGLNVINALKSFAWHLLHHELMVFAVTFFCATSTSSLSPATFPTRAFSKPGTI